MFLYVGAEECAENSQIKDKKKSQLSSPEMVTYITFTRALDNTVKAERAGQPQYKVV